MPPAKNLKPLFSPEAGKVYTEADYTLGLEYLPNGWYRLIFSGVAPRTLYWDRESWSLCQFYSDVAPSIVEFTRSSSAQLTFWKPIILECISVDNLKDLEPSAVETRKYELQTRVIR